MSRALVVLALATLPLPSPATPLISQADFRASWLSDSLHGNRAGCGGYYDRADLTYLAAPPARYAAWPCGTYLQVAGPNGSITAIRKDSCPGCPANQVDLSPAAFEQVCGPRSMGVCRVTVTTANSAMTLEEE